MLPNSATREQFLAYLPKMAHTVCSRVSLPNFDLVTTGCSQANLPKTVGLSAQFCHQGSNSGPICPNWPKGGTPGYIYPTQPPGPIPTPICPNWAPVVLPGLSAQISHQGGTMGPICPIPPPGSHPRAIRSRQLKGGAQGPICRQRGSSKAYLPILATRGTTWAFPP